MTPSLEEAHRFLGLARADFEAFQVLAASVHIRSAIALFHAQQSVEKSLKAVLFAKKLEFRRTHDLIELADKLRLADAAVPCSTEALARLNPYAVLYRYDSDDLGLASVEDAGGLAQGIWSWAELQVRAANP
jgi:HEPN domain-containing protein